MKGRKTQEKNRVDKSQATEVDTTLDPAPGISSIIREKNCIHQGSLEEQTL